MNERTVVPGQIEGFLAGCPFCSARQKTSPEIGAKFRIISGFSAGQTGVVVQGSERYSLRPTEILVHMDADAADVDRLLLLDHKLIQELPAPPVPAWAPFLSFPDAAIVDEAVVAFCSASYSGSQWRLNSPRFYEVARVAWQHRLPITGLEISDLLSAHGVKKPWKSGLADFFDKGIELLVHANGRKPIQKRRTRTRLGQ